MSFSKSAEALLLSAGWFPGRRVNIQKYITYFRQEGYPILPQAIEFLSEFGDLHIHPNDQSGKPNPYNSFHFDPLQVSAYHERIQDYSLRVKELVCIIGEANSQYMTTMMGPGGLVYAGADDLLEKIGNDGIEAIEALCSGEGRREQIPDNSQFFEVKIDTKNLVYDIPPRWR